MNEISINDFCIRMPMYDNLPDISPTHEDTMIEKKISTDYFYQKLINEDYELCCNIILKGELYHEYLEIDINILIKFAEYISYNKIDLDHLKLDELNLLSKFFYHQFKMIHSENYFNKILSQNSENFCIILLFMYYRIVTQDVIVGNDVNVITIFFPDLCKTIPNFQSICINVLCKSNFYTEVINLFTKYPEIFDDNIVDNFIGLLLSESFGPNILDKFDHANLLLYVRNKVNIKLTNQNELIIKDIIKRYLRGDHRLNLRVVSSKFLPEYLTYAEFIINTFGNKKEVQCMLENIIYNINLTENDLLICDKLFALLINHNHVIEMKYSTAIMFLPQYSYNWLANHLINYCIYMHPDTIKIMIFRIANTELTAKILDYVVYNNIIIEYPIENFFFYHILNIPRGNINEYFIQNFAVCKYYPKNVILPKNIGQVLINELQFTNIDSYEFDKLLDGFDANNIQYSFDDINVEKLYTESPPILYIKFPAKYIPWLRKIEKKYSVKIPKLDDMENYISAIIVN